MDSIVKTAGMAIGAVFAAVTGICMILVEIGAFADDIYPWGREGDDE